MIYLITIGILLIILIWHKELVETLKSNIARPKLFIPLLINVSYITIIIFLLKADQISKNNHKNHPTKNIGSALSDFGTDLGNILDETKFDLRIIIIMTVILLVSLFILINFEYKRNEIKLGLKYSLISISATIALLMNLIFLKVII